MTETKVIPIKLGATGEALVSEEQPQVEVQQDIKLVLNTSRGQVDISDSNSMGDIRKCLAKAKVPKKEIISTMDYLNGKFKSGELVFYDRAKSGSADGETSENVEKVTI